jgi:hypothetical protein
MNQQMLGICGGLVAPEIKRTFLEASGVVITRVIPVRFPNPEMTAPTAPTR